MDQKYEDKDVVLAAVLAVIRVEPKRGNRCRFEEFTPQDTTLSGKSSICEQWLWIFSI